MIQKYAYTATLIGITSQLFETRMGHHLAPFGMTVAQFALLNHLVRHSEQRHTIKDLTQEMEVNQPAISKVIQKFSQQGLVEAVKDEQDSRKKWITVTDQGREMVQAVMKQTGPDVVQWFEGWEESEIDEMTRLLEKLSYWLDANRL